MYKIIDNYAPKELLAHFKKTLFSEQFPWYYHDYVASIQVKESEEFYFTHTFFSDGENHTFGVNSDYFEKIIVPLCFIRFVCQSTTIRLYDYMVILLYGYMII